VCFTSIYENRRLKPVEIVLRRVKVRIMERVNPSKINCNHNVTVYPTVRLFYANKIIQKRNVFLIIVEVGKSKMKLVADSVSSEGPTSGLQKDTFLQCLHMAE
jgi:hypothetical protein